MSARIRLQLRLLIVTALSVAALCAPSSAAAAADAVITGIHGGAADDPLGEYVTDGQGYFAINVANVGDQSLTVPYVRLRLPIDDLTFNEFGTPADSLWDGNPIGGAPTLAGGMPACDTTSEVTYLEVTCDFAGPFPAGSSTDIVFTTTPTSTFEYGSSTMDIAFIGVEDSATMSETTDWLAGPTYLELGGGYAGPDADGEMDGAAYYVGDTLEYKLRLAEIAAESAETAHGITVHAMFDPEVVAIDPNDVTILDGAITAPDCSLVPDEDLMDLACSFEGGIQLDQASTISIPATILDQDWYDEIWTSFSVETANQNLSAETWLQERTTIEVDDAPFCDLYSSDPGVAHHGAGATISFDLDDYCTDPEGEPLTYAVNGADPSGVAMHGAVAIDPVTHVLTWTPTGDYRGYDGAAITVSDGEHVMDEYVRLGRYERADLGVLLEGPTSATSGVPVTFTATVRNLATFAPAEAATSATVSVFLPSYANPAAAPAGCALHSEVYVDYSVNWYECSVANLASGASSSFAITFTPMRATDAGHSAGISAWVFGSGHTTSASMLDDDVFRTFTVAVPVPPTCAAGQTGTYPNCVTPPTTCPIGKVGTPPNCLTPQQQLKKTMDGFLQNLAGLQNLVTTILGPLQFGGQVTAVQPKGGAVAKTNGQVVTGVVACKKACTWTVAYSAVYTPKAGTARAKKRVAKAVKLRLPAQRLSLKPGKPGALKTKLTKKQLAQVKKGKAPKIVAVVSYKVGKVVKKKTVTFKLKFAPRKR